MLVRGGRAGTRGENEQSTRLVYQKPHPCSGGREVRGPGSRLWPTHLDPVGGTIDRFGGRPWLQHPSPLRITAFDQRSSLTHTSCSVDDCLRHRPSLRGPPGPGRAARVSQSSRAGLLPAFVQECPVRTKVPDRLGCAKGSIPPRRIRQHEPLCRGSGCGGIFLMRERLSGFVVPATLPNGPSWISNYPCNSKSARTSYCC